jgi:hypothetical protein
MQNRRDREAARIGEAPGKGKQADLPVVSHFEMRGL